MYLSNVLAATAQALTAFVVPAHSAAGHEADASGSRWTGNTQVAQACVWFVFVGCARSYEAARPMAGNGLEIIFSSDYRGLRPGWYCAVVGPYQQKPAAAEVNAIRQDVPDAYAKRAC